MDGGRRLDSSNIMMFFSQGSDVQTAKLAVAMAGDAAKELLGVDAPSLRHQIHDRSTDLLSSQVVELPFTKMNRGCSPA